MSDDLPFEPIPQGELHKAYRAAYSEVVRLARSVPQPTRLGKVVNRLHLRWLVIRLGLGAKIGIGAQFAIRKTRRR